MASVAKVKRRGILMFYWSLNCLILHVEIIVSTIAQPPRRELAQYTSLLLVYFFTICLVTEFDKACMHCYAKGFITLTTNCYFPSHCISAYHIVGIL